MNKRKSKPEGTATGKPVRERAPLRPLMILLAISLAVRIVYLCQIATNPFFHYPVIDAQTYDEMAVRIAAGEEPIPAPFFQPPLYPFILGLLYALFGRDLLLARLLQAAMGTASAGLLYALARRLFDRRVGFAAALIFSCYGPMIFYEGEFLAPVLIVFLNLLLAHAALVALERPSLPRACLCGGLLGLSALAMSVILPLVILLPLYAWHRWRGLPGRPGPGRALALLSVFAGGLLLAVAPVTWRNWRVGREFVPISTNAGINFYLSTGSDYERKLAIRPGYEWDRLLNEPIRLGIRTAGGQSAYFMDKALGLIAADPAGYARLLLKKLFLFANGNEIMRDLDIYPFRQYSSLLSLLAWKKWLAFPFGVLLPLALLGMAMALRHRVTGAGLLLLIILAHVAVLLAFFITARYRLNILPFLIAFAAYGALQLWERLRRRYWRQALLPLSGLLALLLLCNARVGSMSRDLSVDAYYNLGTKLLNEGNSGAAKGWLLKAAGLDPFNPEVNGNLGIIYEQEQLPQQAGRCFRRILERYPDDVKAHLHLADLYGRTGELEKSVRHFEEVLRVEPENEMALWGRDFVRGLISRRAAAVGSTR